MAKDKDKRIIILASDNIKEGWFNNIHNPDANEKQCTNTEYQNEIADMKKNINEVRNKYKDRKSVVSKYYEFVGYQKFIKGIDKLVNNVNIDEETAIKRKFTNRVLIIDEVHNIRNIGKKKKKAEDEEDEEDEDEDVIIENKKDIINLLEKVVKYSDNLKLIMLSATPMYNEANKCKLINLMLLNDKKTNENFY